MDSPAKLVLFDIDGTLLLSKGIGRLSIKQAMIATFGVGGSIDTCNVGGRSYLEIVEDALDGTGVTRENISRRWELFNEQVVKTLASNLQKGLGQVVPLPGGISLVEALSMDPRVVLGIITGNPAGASWLKLETAGYKKSQFKVNVFGDEALTRAGLVELARRRAFSMVGKDFPGRQTVIIGDTINDVSCARQSGACSLIVLTGYDAEQVLRGSGPDFIFKDLTDRQSIEQALFASTTGRQ